jgi:L-ascorbate metabolism protein UlaG (beta-lactamase superfamily)
MRLTWYGQSFFELETATGTTVLVDPWMDGNPMNDATTEDFDPDVVTITHGHADHTTDAHRFDGVPVIGQPETGGFLAERGYDDVVTMNVSGTYEHDGVSFTMTKAFHSSGAPLDADYDYPMGTPVGYVIDDGETKFYHAGDTGLFGDMKTVIRDVFAPDVAAVPIGDRHTMGPDLAGTAVDWLGVDAALPMHYDTFPILEQDPQAFVDAVTDAEVFVPDVGETIDY